MSAPVLVVDDLSVRFAGAPAAVVEGLNFTVRPGRTLALVGESGCGKSVTSMALMGLLPPTARIQARQASFMGEDLLTMPETRRRDLRGDRLAMVFQEPMTSLNPAFSVGEQLMETVLRHRGGSQATARQRALEMLEKVRVPAAAQRLAAYPHELSGGMRQRVMIAIALAMEPDVLIADEPTTALDVTVQAQILDLLRTLQKKNGMAILFITHNFGVVAEIADRVMVMYAGRIVEQGSVGQVLASPRMPYTRGLLAAVPRFEHAGLAQGELGTIAGFVPDPSAPPAGCAFHPRCAYSVAGRCDSEAPALEEIERGHHLRCVRWQELAVEGGAR